MALVEATSPKPQRYLVLSETRAKLEQELNRLAEKGYKPILMSTEGSTICVILERDG